MRHGRDFKNYIIKLSFSPLLYLKTLLHATDVQIHLYKKHLFIFCSVFSFNYICSCFLLSHTLPKEKQNSVSEILQSALLSVLCQQHKMTFSAKFKIEGEQNHVGEYNFYSTLLLCSSTHRYVSHCVEKCALPDEEEIVSIQYIIGGYFNNITIMVQSH